MLNANKKQLNELRYCVSRIQQAMVGGKGFITVDSLDSYIRKRLSVEGEEYAYWLSRLRSNIINGSVDCSKFGEDVVDSLRQSGMEIAISIREFDFSPRLFNCLARNGIMYVADLFNYSENDIARFRNMGDKSLNELKSRLSAIKINLFTDDELEDLAKKEFDFYLENRTAEDFEFLGLSSSLINKVIENKLLCNSKSKLHTANSDKNVLNDKNIFAGVPEDARKYVALGLGEEVKHSVENQKKPFKNSDRIITGIIKPAKPFECDYRKGILDESLERSLVLSEVNKDKSVIYLLSEDVIAKYQDALWDIITYGKIDKVTKTKLLKYVDDVCAKQQNITK